MNLLQHVALASSSGNEGAKGLLGIAIVIGLCWFVAEMNKPKGYDIHHLGKTEIRPR